MENDNHRNGSSGLAAGRRNSKDQTRTIVIVGASSAIAEHCARLWVKDSAVNLMLIGRNLDKLNPIADDLRIRSPHSTISTQAVDFYNPIAIQQWVDEISKTPVDLVLIAHGSLPAQDACQANLSLANETLQTNAISPALIAEAFAGHMQRKNHGTLAVIGSVAGDRGRKSNYVYGAAKGFITRFVEGLQHRLAGTNVQVTLIKPGPTATPMTENLPKNPGRMAPVDAVAQEIVAGINKKKAVIYTPIKWALIMLIIRHLPAFIFNKMDI